MDEVMSSFPRAVLVTLAIVFALMLLFFRAVFVAVRALLTVVMTLAFSYGSLALIYQHGILAFLNTRNFANTHGLAYFAPVLAFSAVVGLSLDYDIFLLVRYVRRGVSVLFAVVDIQIR
jgi:RND superfamily putative drug exporter